MNQVLPIIAGPAYTIRTPRLTLRCHDPAEAPALNRLIEENLEHLGRWMAWVDEHPCAVDSMLARLRQFRSRFDQGEDFIYAVADRTSGALIGGGGLHRRVGPGALEIGYWIAASHCNRGLATELTIALTQVAFEVEHVDRVEIRVAVGNEPSLRVVEKCGYRREGILRGVIALPRGEKGDAVVSSMLRKEYIAGACPSLATEAFDAMGRPITRTA